MQRNRIMVACTALLTLVCALFCSCGSEDSEKEAFMDSLRFMLQKEEGVMFNDDFYVSFEGTDRTLNVCDGRFMVLGSDGKVASQTFFKMTWNPGENIHIQVPISKIKHPIQGCAIDFKCEQGRTQREWRY